MNKLVIWFSMSLILFVIAVSGRGNSPAQTLLTDAVNGAASKSAHGLCLSFSLDSTIYQPGQQITMSIDEQNTLTKINLVHSASRWPLNGLGLGPSYPCGIFSNVYPFGIAVFKGNYTRSNLDSSMLLNLNKPNEIIHGCILRLGHNFVYHFKPLCDILYYDNMNSDLNNSPMQYDVKLTGYWTSDTIPQLKISTLGFKLLSREMNGEPWLFFILRFRNNLLLNVTI